MDSGQSGQSRRSGQYGLNKSTLSTKSIVHFCIALGVSCSLCADEASICKRVEAHLLIKDCHAALQEALEGIKAYPSSPLLYQALIKSHAKVGNEKAMLAAWDRYQMLTASTSSQACQKQSERDLIEAMAWGVIEKEIDSPLLPTHLIALLAAFFSQDIKGVDILCGHLRHANSAIRAVSAQLASHFRDDKLCQEMLFRLQQEKVWSVRLEIIKALGKMKLLEAKEPLEQLIADKERDPQEQIVAIHALVNLMESADRSTLVRLAQSSRAGWRSLACQIVIEFQLHEEIDLLIPLLSDPRADVRLQAVTAMGLLRPYTDQGQSLERHLMPLLCDANSFVAMRAAWAMTLLNPSQGHSFLQRWLIHEEKQIRWMAASMLAATGKYGLPLAKKAFKESQDPYVRLNLAIGLIGQQAEVGAACHALSEILAQEKVRWKQQQEGPFSAIVPATFKEESTGSVDAEATNQLTRLEVLNILAIAKSSYAQKAIKAFLKEQHLHVTEMTLALLLTEGDSEAIELVKALLSDEEHKVRLQAALILAFWGKEESTLQWLQQAYPSANSEEKEKILQALAAIGSDSSLSFFLQALKEPYSTRRLIAAAGLIQCLNH